MNKVQNLVILNILITMFFSSIPIYGQGNDQNQNRRRHPRKPPQEAFDACEKKQEKDSCSVTTREGDELQGICRTMRDDFVCVPNDMFRERRKGTRGSRSSDQPSGFDD